MNIPAREFVRKWSTNRLRPCKVTVKGEIVGEWLPVLSDKESPKPMSDIKKTMSDTKIDTKPMSNKSVSDTKKPHKKNKKPLSDIVYKFGKPQCTKCGFKPQAWQYKDERICQACFKSIPISKSLEYKPCKPQ